MSRVTIRVSTEDGDVQIVEASTLETVETLLDRALIKVCAAYDILPESKTPNNIQSGVTLSDTSRALLYRAYDDGDGGTFSLVSSKTPGYFEGLYNGDYVMEGTEVGGTLYSICSNSGGGTVSVLVGAQIIDSSAGLSFSSESEARAYVSGLMERD